MTLVDSPTRSWDTASPHWAQHRLPSGSSWPHRVRGTFHRLGCGPAAGLGTGRGRPADDGPDGPSRVGCRELSGGPWVMEPAGRPEGQPDVQVEEPRVSGGSPEPPGASA